MKKQYMVIALETGGNAVEAEQKFPNLFDSYQSAVDRFISIVITMGFHVERPMEEVPMRFSFEDWTLELWIITRVD